MPGRGDISPRARTTVTAAVLALGLLGSGISSARSTTPKVDFRDTGRVHVVSEKRLDDRQYVVRVQSPSLGRPVDVRVLLPRGYDPAAARRYPVLYLFHGTMGHASDWVHLGGAARATAAHPVITVMPDAGFNGNGGGWFTNWVDTRTGLGPSRWESFHIEDVLPWIDTNLRTVKGRQGRAIAGVSQGGFGSMTYAARHPDLFSSAASFSGVSEIARDPDMAVGAGALIAAAATGLNRTQPDAMFGNAVTNRVNWLGHDPAMLVDNLRNTSVYLWAAAGPNGQYDDDPDPAGTSLEALTHQSSQRFHEHLEEAGVLHYYNDYKFGTHTWPYFARDLEQYLPRMMSDFAHATTPRRITYVSVDKAWSRWGWSVAVDREAAQDFTGLLNAGAAGFELSAEGTSVVAVTTPPVYRAGSLKRVAIDGMSRSARVRPDGRLRIRVRFDGAARTVVTVR